MLWIIALVVVLIIVFLVIRAYNTLIKQRNRVDTAWSHVDVQLQRRSDLIPNLVETVKGYASHERETFERVTKARGASNSASTPAEQAQADNFLTSALRQLFAVAEDYPELRASENFQNLQEELSETEDKIAISRQIYNDTVLSYNNTVQQIPGFKAREFYDAGPGAEEAPEVSF
jgi:LemA protein